MVNKEDALIGLVRVYYQYNCYIGDAGVGKTSIVRRYTDGIFTSAGIPTIGVDFCIKTLNIDGSAIKVLSIIHL